MSTTNTGTELAEPCVAAVTPEVANLAASNVPDEMFVALVVSVVAEAAKPDTALEAIAMDAPV